MKKLLSLIACLVCCVSPHQAASIITATITVTNAPADGDTLVVNADTRTWKTSVATPSTQILIGASIGANATNLFSQLAYAQFTTLSPSRSGTNGVSLRGIVGQTISVTISGTWGYYTLTTNTATDATAVRVPMSAEPTASKATNIASQLAVDLGTFSTNPIATGTTLVIYLVQTNGTQTITGVKTFTGANVYRNAAQLFDGGAITNVDLGARNIWVQDIATYGTFSMTNTTPIMLFYDSDGSLDNKGFSINAEDGDLTFVVFSDDFLTYSIPLQIQRTGTTVDKVWLPHGEVEIGGSGSPTDHLRVVDTIRFDRYDHTTLANGNNAAVDLGNNTFVRISSGPSAAFAICGIANGANGQMHIIYNATGQNMTISNDSGVDPTAANRIYTNTGADIATTGNGSVTLIYDSGASRWIVTALQQ